MSQLMSLSPSKIFIFSLVYIGLIAPLYAKAVLETPLEETAEPHYQARQVQLKAQEVIGKKRLIFNQGDNIRLVIESDQALDLHIHGYDIKKKLIADLPLIIEFKATNSGRFSVTSHGSKKEKALLHNDHTALFYLEIYPQ